MDEAPRASSPASARLVDLSLLGRHQLAAAIATLVDFASMVGLVELFAAPPPFATLFSAGVGGATNFALGRAWAFRSRHRGTLGSQAGRYALVCVGGALLNASLLGAILGLAAPPYVVGRVVASIAVSLLYTYPMHARFVFRVAGSEP